MSEERAQYRLGGQGEEGIDLPDADEAMGEYEEEEAVVAEKEKESPVERPAQALQTLDMAMFPASKDAGDFKAISNAAASSLILWTKNYGLDAWAGHACYMFGKPYVTEKGAIANAINSEAYGGYSLTKLTEEQAKALDFPWPGTGWECQVEVRSENSIYVIKDYGWVSQAERDLLKDQALRNLKALGWFSKLSAEDQEREIAKKLSYLPLERNPSGMAKVRAIRATHLRAFPLRRDER